MIHEEQVAKAVAEVHEAFRLASVMVPDTDAASWKVTVPEYDHDGVLIERFEVTAEYAQMDKLKAAFNPQRSDRSVDPGWYTRLTVDEVLWMTDTPAEVRDVELVDDVMSDHPGGTMLIVGLGIGLVLHRAIVRRGMSAIDVVEREERVLRAVAPHYLELAHAHGCELHFHCADIHQWKVPRGSTWDIGFFDIWPTIDQEDMPEVTRLRKRFHSRTNTFVAWAQDERIAQAKRRRNRTGWY
jgi:hypothetical protein